jgi:hypothetical protein
MATYSLDLLFLGDPKAEIPGPPKAYVHLKNWSGLEVPKDVPIITPDCVTLKELEYQVGRLHKELDAILAKAAKKFSTYDKAQQEHFASRRSH